MSSPTRRGIDPKIVALLLDGARGWDAGLLRGIASYANLHQPWRFLRHAVTYYQQFFGLSELTLDALLRQSPDGVVMHESEITGELLDRGVPCIVVPSREIDPRGYYVTCDNESAGAAAAEHLVSLGLRNFGFVGFSETFWSQMRLSAFRSYLENRGHRLHEHSTPLVAPEADRPKHHVALAQWLQDIPKPIGVFAANDDIARPVAELCQVNGIAIPDQVALLGVDNDELICELNNPPLSSVPFATEQSGYRVAEMLDCLMSGGEPESTSVDTVALPVVARRSTDLLAIEDVDVVRAVRFIRDNASRIIQVGDVVKATNLSRRTLHDRFKASLGHSIGKEINRQRALHIAELLTETSLSISRIAWNLGYKDDAHLVRFFRREMGEPPGAYRRRLS